MSATHVALPIPTAEAALLALKAFEAEIGAHYELIKSTPGTARFHLSEMHETAQKHVQAASLALVGCRGPSLASMAKPLIAEAMGFVDSAQTTLSVEDYGDALTGIQRCLAGLKLLVSSPEGGARA